MASLDGELFWTAAQPIVKVVLLCGVGAVAARRGLLPPEMRRYLSALIFNIFIPCLLFDSLVPVIDTESVRDWWPLLLCILLAVVTGFGVGWLVGLCTRCPKHLRRVLVAAVGLANVGNLPLVLIEELGRDEESPLAGLGRRGLGYVGVTLALATLSHFLLGYQLLKPRPGERIGGGQGPSQAASVRRPGGDEGASPKRRASDPGAEHSSQSTESLGRAVDAAAQRAGSQHKPEHAEAERANSAHVSVSPPAAAKKAGGLGAGLTRLFTQLGGHWPSQNSLTASGDEEARAPRGASRLVRAWAWWGAVAQRWHLKEVFTPPTVATLLSFVVGFAEPVKWEFFRKPGSDNDPALKVVTSAVRSLGQAAIPSMMVVLGSNIQNGPPRECELSWYTVLATLVCKLVLLPGVGVLLVYGGYSVGAFKAPDPAFLFVMFITWSMPSAINLQTMSNMSGYAVAELSTLLFWQYVACIAVLPPFLTLYLSLSDEVAVSES
ncbi:unnamed protein product [Pedinophyceae sp. YPF-701]|nr:unnamed protein product [Pedinophyceae sp. YPF-701]